MATTAIVDYNPEPCGPPDNLVDVVIDAELSASWTADLSRDWPGWLRYAAAATRALLLAYGRTVPKTEIEEYADNGACFAVESYMCNRPYSLATGDAIDVAKSCIRYGVRRSLRDDSFGHRASPYTKRSQRTRPELLSLQALSRIATSADDPALLARAGLLDEPTGPEPEPESIDIDTAYETWRDSLDSLRWLHEAAHECGIDICHLCR